ncbi:dynamin family protein [Streptomyces sp. NPDC001678]|uniref:dynamin family protein n=1 Tax=Streptomyces sp. NPDC001678 TaxID=3364599 RepID=UPI0036CBE791
MLSASGSPASGGSDDWTFGSGALAAFGAARRRILDAILDGRRTAARMMPQNPGLLRMFDEAARAMDDCRLNLVVLGAEGAGKSTLVNALLGAPVTPQEGTRTGTVVPVVVEWADTDSVQYSVALDTSPVQEIGCADFDAFGDYVLGDRNNDNHKRVLRGYVRMRNPLLENHVRLIDVPGLEGVSPRVAERLHEFLGKEAHTVIGVCRDRFYGPLVRATDQWAGTDLRIAALVANWSFDAWVQNSARQETWMEESRTAVRRVMTKDSVARVDPANVFVLHLPTLLGTTPRGLRVGGRPHRAEARRFVRAVTAYMARNGADALLFEAHGRAVAALAELEAFLAFRAGTLRAVLSPDPSAARQLAGEVAGARRAAEDAWAAVSGQATASALAGRQWPAYRGAMVRARADLLDETGRIETRVLTEHKRISKPVVAESERTLSDAVGKHDEIAFQAFERAVQPVLDFYNGHAQHAFEVFFDRLPLLRIATDPLVGPPGERGEIQVPDLGDDRRAKLKRGAGAGATAAVGGAAVGYGLTTAGITISLGETAAVALGGILGGGGAAAIAAAGGAGTGAAAGGTAAVGATAGLGALVLTPVGLLLTATLVAGALGYGVFSWLRVGSQHAFKRGIDSMRRQLCALDTADEGALHRTFLDACRAIADEVGRRLAERFDALEALASPGDGEAAQLRREAAGITEARRHIVEIGRGMDRALRRLDDE